MNIGYFADGPWGHRTFKKINADKNYKIKFVCVRYDSKDSTFSKYCEDNYIDYLKVKNINEKSFFDKLNDYKCDLFVSMSFNQIFKSSLINLPPLKTINCHAGKLPFYRGRNILNWVLINDETEFGITVHYMDEGIDTGDIILQKTYPITDNDNYSTLLETAYRECPRLLYKAINQIRENKIRVVKQKSIHPTGSYCSQRKKGDEIINWNQSSRALFNFVRAISLPGPQARSFIGKNEIFINNAEYIGEAPKYKGTPGVVLQKNNKHFLVKTGDSFLKITDWQCDCSIKVGSRLQ